MKPSLRTKTEDWALGDYPDNTAFEAGHLTQKNSGWRSERPVINEGYCTGCLQCYLYCPDGTIYPLSDPLKGPAKVGIDYDFCKGCGICAKVCKAGAITMEAENTES
jgi:2-oxoacid:acceptor oxidoreductase delta subunit (pyruvate/2-ketoisovalerate family)